jgi:hypothetical protein
MSKQLVSQTKNAIDFIQKLYFEISYLIKEVEGLLGQEGEEFIIGRPSGYHVTSRTSSGLEPINVEFWFPKSLTVFFTPSQFTQTIKGQTITPFRDDLKLLLLDIQLASRKDVGPRIAAGCIFDLKNKREKSQSKFENLMWEFAYEREKIFSTLPEIHWEDSYLAFKGKFFVSPLFSINDGESVVEKIVNPMLEIYRGT